MSVGSVPALVLFGERVNNRGGAGASLLTLALLGTPALFRSDAARNATC